MFATHCLRGFAKYTYDQLTGHIMPAIQLDDPVRRDGHWPGLIWHDPRQRPFLSPFPGNSTRTPLRNPPSPTTSLATPLASGLAQLDSYLDRFRLDTGTLVIFDNREKAAPIRERSAITTAHSPSGHTITLLRA
jgi:hypothetical protein